MAQKRWWRILPDRSQFTVLAIALAFLLAAVSFVNLAAAKGQALAERQAARQAVQQAEEQKTRLQDLLTGLQRGQGLPARAWQYFGFTASGVTVVVPQRTAEPGAASRMPAEPPYWDAWWQRLRQP